MVFALCMQMLFPSSTASAFLRGFLRHVHVCRKSHMQAMAVANAGESVGQADTMEELCSEGSLPFTATSYSVG